MLDVQRAKLSLRCSFLLIQTLILEDLRRGATDTLTTASAEAQLSFPFLSFRSVHHSHFFKSYVKERHAYMHPCLFYYNLTLSPNVVLRRMCVLKNRQENP